MRWWLALVVVACGTPPASKQPTVGNTTPDPHRAPPQGATAVPINRERVHFEVDGAALLATETAVLDRVVHGMKADPALTVQVSGHADAGERDVEAISQRRATVVRDYLIAHGIPQRRLLTRSVGTAEPRDARTTDTGRAGNRRVEFQLVTIHVDPIGGRVVITDTDVEMLDPVTFEPGKVTLRPTSFAVLDAVVSTLQGNPSILLVEVQSHVDERGDDVANMRLTEARARIVRKYLIDKGIDPARLTAQGYGETQPIDRGHDEAAWAKNTRVEFLILKRR